MKMLTVVPRVYDLGETEEECGEVLSDTGPSLVLVPYLLLLKFIDSSKKNTRLQKVAKKRIISPSSQIDHQ